MSVSFGAFEKVLYPTDYSGQLDHRLRLSMRRPDSTCQHELIRSISHWPETDILDLLIGIGGQIYVSEGAPTRPCLTVLLNAMSPSPAVN